ncbi:hypothetical protein [Singulisphaera sp. PoT]|uniref:hypothetical protein n=1 Tax=Singulisphaera sp. PoT TaxID=3411797 RepID=UPI003BF526F5
MHARRPFRIPGGFVLVATLLVGCSGTPQGPPVDAGHARETLKASLDSWKNGDSPEALKSRQPPIMMQDLDWMAGAKLVDYELTSDGRKAESNLFVPVKLTLRTSKGQVKKEVSYIVGTSPSLTIYREL